MERPKLKMMGHTGAAAASVGHSLYESTLAEKGNTSALKELRVAGCFNGHSSELALRR